jgi:hypothetical protein
MNCSRNFDGSNAIGNGEVDSSILSGSTIHLFEIYAFILIDLDWPSIAELNWNHRVTTRCSFAAIPGLSHHRRERPAPNDREQFTVG